MSEIREKLISEIAEDTVKLSKDYPSAVECANELREMLNEGDSEESNLLKLFFGKIESERQAHLQTKKELEELQDAIAYRGRNDFTKREKENGLEIYYKLTEADKVIGKAIEASRKRNKSDIKPGE